MRRMDLQEAINVVTWDVIISTDVFKDRDYNVFGNSLQVKVLGFLDNKLIKPQNRFRLGESLEIIFEHLAFIKGPFKDENFTALNQIVNFKIMGLMTKEEVKNRVDIAVGRAQGNTDVDYLRMEAGAYINVLRKNPLWLM